MGSKVEPYFILTAEKIRDPKELQELEKKTILETVLHENTPATPPPSGVSGNNGFELGPTENPHRKKKIVKYKIPVKELKRKDSLNKRMELIKEKLEKSRERFHEQRSKREELDLKCEPSKSYLDEEGTVINPFKMDRSVSDLTHLKSGPGVKHELISSSCVYFVVTDENLAREAGERIISKSAGKRRRVRRVEENRLKRDRRERQKPEAKKLGLAREVGLKSSLDSKSESCQNEIPAKPAVNHIVFEGPDTEPPKPVHQSSAKIIRSLHSPPKIPPGTPATTMTVHSITQSGESKQEQPPSDADENVPRKPFLSGPLYCGKNRTAHSSLQTQHFELPNISADQKRRALGMGTKFEEFAYPKPQTEQKQRRVSFADPLPVIRGNGFIVDHHGELSEENPSVIPALGPRAVTMGSITLPSEKLDKHSVCEKYLAGENIASARTVRRYGIPLPLPKIDIVSSVYDEMIIKMIQEYLQDANTPSRQSQLAKELLVHLQKHNEHMKELNVPNAGKKWKPKLSKEDTAKHQQKAQQLMNDLNFTVPPNTAEDSGRKVMTPMLNTRDHVTSNIPEVPTETAERRDITSADNPRSVPFVQITFKHREEEPVSASTINADVDVNKQNSKSAAGERKSQSKPILSAVTPVSFQMAPPGLSRDSSFISVPLRV